MARSRPGWRAKRLEAAKASGRYKQPIVTQIEPAPAFWKAEDYHQRYFEKHGGHLPCQLCGSGEHLERIPLMLEHIRRE